MAINSVNFAKFSDADLATSDTDQYTAPASTTSLVISMILGNKTGSVVTVSVKVVRSGGATTLVIVKDAPIPVGGALDVIANKPIVLSTGDKIQAACTTGGATAVDVTGSVLETT